MAANYSAPEVKSTSNPTMAPAPPIIPYFHDSALLTDRQKRRRLEKAVVKRGFEGNIIINSDPREATRHARLEYQNASHLGDKDSRMVFWTKGSTHSVGVGLRVTSGLGIVSQTSPDPDQWVWGAYGVMDEIDTQMAEYLAVAMALKVAKDECDKLAKIEMPSKVVVYSNASDALLRMQELNFVMRSGVRMVKAGVRVVEAG
jgi:hypothetical protein